MDKKIDIPRRSCIDQFTPAEKAIYDAIQEVEKVGADLRLTNAITHLQQAKEFVSDYVDGIPEKVEEGLSVIDIIGVRIIPIIGKVYHYEGVAVRCLERNVEGCGDCYLTHRYCANIVCVGRVRDDNKDIMFREVER